jgi:predicted dinucleotide-binding enzyme
MLGKRFDGNTGAGAVWLVCEHGDDYDSEWVAMRDVIRLGMHAVVAGPCSPAR